MSIEKTQSNKVTQALEMARRSLGQAKEMDLTPEQKKQVMTMIRQAKEYEAQKELSKALNKYIALKAYLDNIKKPPKSGLNGVMAMTKEGEPVDINFDEELEKSKEFYEKEGVDWVTFPENNIISDNQANEMTRCIREFGFNKVMIIPAGLADDKNKMNKIHKLMTKYYPLTKYEPDYQKYAHNEFLEKRKNLRIILYRDQRGLDDLYLKTRGKTAQQLMAKGGLMETLGLEGLSEAEFLVLQQKHFLDFPADYMYMGDQVMLLGSNLMKGIDDLVVTAQWDLEGTRSPKSLIFNGCPSNVGFSGLGCPLVKTFEIEP